MLPNQIEASKFRPPPFLFPNEKRVGPFHTWSIDAAVRLTPTNPLNGAKHLIVCVDAFSKWVEIGTFDRLLSTSVMDWFHENIVCRYGVPVVVRCDNGKEFQGDFKLYLQSMGVR